MGLDFLKKVILNRHERVEPSHWVLEDQRNLLPPDSAKRVIVQMSKVTTVIDDLATNRCVWWENS